MTTTIYVLVNVIIIVLFVLITLLIREIDK